ncbi:MAG: hypothetical protein J6N49_03465 [Alphaproteobacteria bacterium]|nr:hypothetical protein [Alphaproteobacteria bacterium]
MADIQKVAEKILNISDGDLENVKQILKEEYGITPFVPDAKQSCLQTFVQPPINFCPLKTKSTVETSKKSE